MLAVHCEKESLLRPVFGILPILKAIAWRDQPKPRPLPSRTKSPLREKQDTKASPHLHISTRRSIELVVQARAQACASLVARLPIMPCGISRAPTSGHLLKMNSHSGLGKTVKRCSKTS